MPSPERHNPSTAQAKRWIDICPQLRGRQLKVERYFTRKPRCNFVRRIGVEFQRELSLQVVPMSRYGRVHIVRSTHPLQHEGGKREHKRNGCKSGRDGSQVERWEPGIPYGATKKRDYPRADPGLIPGSGGMMGDHAFYPSPEFFAGQIQRTCSTQEFRKSPFRFQLFPAMGAFAHVRQENLLRTAQEFIVQIKLDSHAVVIALIHLQSLSTG